MCKIPYTIIYKIKYLSYWTTISVDLRKWCEHGGGCSSVHAHGGGSGKTGRVIPTL